MSSPTDSLRCIWQTVFGDSQEFIDLYFSRRYSRSNTFVSTHEGRIVAQAQCFIYRMTTTPGQPPLKVGYLSGLATLPQYRRQGHARQIMLQLHSWARKKRLDYILLFPADSQAATWYARHFAYRLRHTACHPLISAQQIASYTKLPDLTPRIVSTIINNLASTPYTVQHSVADIQDQLAVCQMSGGGLYALPSSLHKASRGLSPLQNTLLHDGKSDTDTPLFMAERIPPTHEKTANGEPLFRIIDVFNNTDRSMVNGEPKACQSMYNLTMYNVQFMYNLKMYNLDNSRLPDFPSQTRGGAPKGRGRVDNGKPKACQSTVNGEPKACQSTEKPYMFLPIQAKSPLPNNIRITMMLD